MALCPSDGLQERLAVTLGEMRGCLCGAVACLRDHTVTLKLEVLYRFCAPVCLVGGKESDGALGLIPAVEARQCES